MQVLEGKASDKGRVIPELIAQGTNNEQTDIRLGISKLTVKTHVRKIYSKTDIHDKVDLVIRVLIPNKI